MSSLTINSFGSFDSSRAAFLKTDRKETLERTNLLTKSGEPRQIFSLRSAAQYRLTVSTRLMKPVFRGDNQCHEKRSGVVPWMRYTWHSAHNQGADAPRSGVRMMPVVHTTACHTIRIAITTAES